jgi:cystathionine beta-synthase
MTSAPAHIVPLASFGYHRAMPPSICSSILEVIGKTPLVELAHLAKKVPPRVVAKLELLNPGGSVKDRIGIRMIEAAERAGKLKPGGTIIESTSGNTGVGLAIAAALKGYRCIFTMPDKMSQEKINLLRAYGAEVVITPTAVEPEDPRSYYSVARRLSREIPGAFYTNQYVNPANPQTHYEVTGPELWEQTGGEVDVLVIGMGTGGTISGVGRFFKERKPSVQVIGADPVGSLYTDYFKTRKLPKEPLLTTYKVEGIGEDIIPETIDFGVIDGVEQVPDRESFLMARRLCREEGIFAGGSSGTVLAAALRVAERMRKGQTLVVILPDAGGRYLSTFYRDEWMREHQFLESRMRLSAIDVIRRKSPRARGIISVRSSERVVDAVQLLKKRDFSQLPVIDEGKLVGSVREEDLLDLMIHDPKAKEMLVAEVMEAALPMMEEETSIDEVLARLREGAPAVVVRRANGTMDVLTKFDLIHAIS